MNLKLAFGQALFSNFVHYLFAQKNAPMNKTPQGKSSSSKKRSFAAGDQPSAKKKNERLSVHRTTPVGQRIGDKPIPPPAGNSLEVDESSIDDPVLGEKGLTSTILPSDQSGAADLTEAQPDMPISQGNQSDAVAKDGSTFNGSVTQLVAQRQLSVRSASLSSGESYYPDIITTLRVGVHSMSLSNNFVVVFPIKRSDSILLFR